ncbi:MAG TPA: isoprenylcysteine carboxylmethyltransferase family protein [Chloroflexota bacterium]
MRNDGDESARRAARWVWVQIPLLAVTLTVPVAQWMLHLQTSRPPQLIWPARILGLAGIVGAILLFRASQRMLGGDLVATPAPVAGATLRETGVYGRIRHPIYAAIICGVIGWALLWNSVVCLGLALICIAFFLAKTRYEERLLVAHYPGYAEYRRRVPAFLPRLPRGGPHVP